MKLFIKNAYGSQTACLKELLGKLNIGYHPEVILGELNLTAAVTREQLENLKTQLGTCEMAIMFDRKHIIAEQVKYLVKEMLDLEERPNQNYSAYISSRLHLNYTYLANVFSETQAITIEHYIIDQKIEKAKHLFKFGNYSISQVADMLHYSSIGHLSNQFKKVTGKSPSDYKRLVLNDEYPNNTEV